MQPIETKTVIQDNARVTQPVNKYGSVLNKLAGLDTADDSGSSSSSSTDNTDNVFVTVVTETAKEIIEIKYEPPVVTSTIVDVVVLVRSRASDPAPSSIL